MYKNMALKLSGNTVTSSPKALSGLGTFTPQHSPLIRQPPIGQRVTKVISNFHTERRLVWGRPLVIQDNESTCRVSHETRDSTRLNRNFSCHPHLPPKPQNNIHVLRSSYCRDSSNEGGRPNVLSTL